MSIEPRKTTGRVLISDFDGTMTRRDFFQLVVERLPPAGTHDYWGDYLASRLTHFEALKAIFGSVTAGESALLELVESMELEPNLKAEVEALQTLGWRVVVASAGCEWYIRKLLDEAGVTLEVHANPGRLEGGRLVMELPIGSLYFSRETGVDKIGIVQSAIDAGNTVAFAGDGKPDLAPSLLVPGSLRFARGVLAEELTARGEEFRPFDRWAEVAEALRRMG
jgi:2-hydroxy-3-keto-5-methylthiopentenyl-1-phosphate phosphatase